MAKIFKPILIVLFFAFIAGFALLHSGLFPTHDGEYHVIRFIEFNRAISLGNLYPRWAADLNYGYGIPLFNYVYPLPNYFSSFLRIFNVSSIDAFKLNMFVAVILAGVFFYLWAKSLFGEKGALVGSIFYLFSPYFFVDIYIRGSVGEVWALALFPAFLWAVTQMIYKQKAKFLPLATLFLALIIFSHNILALIFFPFAFLYSLLLIYLSKNSKTNFLKCLVLFGLSLGLSAIFWLPALLETKYTVGLQIFDYKSNFVDLYQLILPSWGSGFFGGSLDNQMSVQVGLANLLAVCLSLVVLFKLIRNKDNLWKIIAFFLISFVISIILMLSISLPVWENVPLMNYFQFPWRFLSLTILTCSFLAAALFSVWKSKALAVGLIILVFGLGFSYAHPAYYMQRNDNYYATRSNFIDGTNSIGNSFNTKWFNAKKTRISSKIDMASLKGKVISQNLTVNNYVFNLDLVSNSNIIINTAYFPGWQAFIDDKASDISTTPTGLIQIAIPKGTHLLRVSFEDTPIRQLSSVISLLSFLGLMTLFIRKWYIKNT